jgi:hypothetical protein
MMKTPIRPQIRPITLALGLLLAGGLHAADVGLKNGDFLAGKQFWQGDGKSITLPDDNKVLELTSNTRDTNEAHQGLKLGALPTVEVKFRARFMEGKGKMRASLIRPSGYFTYFTFTLPPDGAWRDVTFKHTRESLKEELTLSLETLPYEGKLQIDDVWAGEPGTHVSVRPMEQPTPVPTKPGRPAVAPAARPSGQLDGFLDALPPGLRTKLSATQIAPEDLAAINAWFAKEAINKPVKLTLVIDTAEVVPNNAMKYRIRAADGLLSGKYPVVRFQQCYAYLPSEKATEVAQEPIGASVTVAARLTRCDLKQFPNGVRLNVDVEDSVWIKNAPAK